MYKNLKIALILSATDKASSVLGKAFSNAERHAKSLEKAGKVIGKIGDQAMIAGGVVTAFFAKTASDARNSVIANNRLEQVFKSMGKTTDAAAKSAADFAGQLQFKIGFEDEGIMAVQAKLATFQSLITQQALDTGIYNRATQVTFDMQAAGFGDAAQNAVQMGKALEDPIKGINSLRKSGITFNDVERAKIKLLVDSGQKLRAQEMILKAVEKQVGGVAAATADPVKRMQLQFFEASESIGKSLLPEINKLADKTAKYIPLVVNWIETHKPLIIMLAKGGVALLAFGVAMKSIAIGISVFTNLMSAIKLVGTVLSTVGRAMLLNPIGLIITAIAIAAFLIYKYWEPIKAFFGKLWTGLKAVFLSFWNFAKNLFLRFTPLGLIINYWKPLSGMFIKIWDNVKTVFTNAWNWITGFGARFFDAGKNIVKMIGKGIEAAATYPVQQIAKMVGKIRDHLPFSPAKIGPLKDLHRIKLVETIAQSINAKPLLKAFGNVTGQLFGQMNQPMPTHAGGGGGSNSIHFAPVINLSGTATQADGDMISNKLKAEFSKMMRDFNANKARVSF